MLSRHDHDLTVRDPDIKGLPWLLDDERMLEMLDAVLPDVVADARVDYLRYKPGSNCLARFTLLAGGLEVTGYAKAYGEDAGVKLEKALRRPSVDSPVGPGRAVVRDAGIELCFFPNDSKMPALARLIDPTRRANVLSRILPGSADLDHIALTTLRYKPQRRHVARVQQPDGTRVLVKTYTRQGYEAARNTVRGIGSGRTLEVPKRLGSSDRHQMIAYEWLPGQVLGNLLDLGHCQGAVLRRVGRALGELHEHAGRGLARSTAIEVAGQCQDALESVVWTLPDLAASANRINGTLRRLFGHEQFSLVPVHGDFYAEQVLINGERVSIIDLDNVVLGNPASDIGLFIAHLEVAALRGTMPVEQIDHIREALCTGYGMVRPVPEGWSIDLHTASGLVHLAPHHFRMREPEWPERTVETLQRASALLQRAVECSGTASLAGVEG